MAQGDAEISDQDIQDRVLFRPIQSLRCLEEGVLRSAAGNIGSIMGIGAPHTGGYIQYVNTYGLDRFITRWKNWPTSTARASSRLQSCANTLRKGAYSIGALRYSSNFFGRWCQNNANKSQNGLNLVPSLRQQLAPLGEGSGPVQFKI